MKLKTKLWISFVCIIFIPLILIVFFGIIMMQYQVRMIENSYGVSANLDDFLPNNNKFYDRLMQRVEGELAEGLRKNAGLLEDKELLNDYLKEQVGDYLNVVVMKDDMLYYSYREIDSEALKVLTREAEIEGKNKNAVYISDQNVILGQVLNTKFQDGTSCEIFLMFKTNQWLPEFKLFFVQFTFSVIFILFLTACIFTIWTYRSILSPLRILQDATIKIKEGNLDFTVEKAGEDEIGALCAGFEEMRQRLKENAEEKIRFDNENRELISNISHDLKTPITSIKGYVEGILDGVADTPEKRERYLRTVYNKSIEMQRLIDELTFYSKIDTNRIPYNYSKINVNDFFGDCEEEVRMELAAKNVDFQYASYVADDVMIIADPEQLKRVINNIVGNSCKYFDKSECHINMRIRDVGDFIQVEIEDNGKGIAQKDIQYIFDRFYRTDSSRNSSKGGSGIGLSIVKKIIEDHNGRVWATSREGTGTVMYFVIRKYQEQIQPTPVREDIKPEKVKPHKADGSIKE